MKAEPYPESLDSWALNSHSVTLYGARRCEKVGNRGPWSRPQLCSASLPRKNRCQTAAGSRCERNRLRDAPQPRTSCCDPRLRFGWQCDWNARAQTQFTL